MSKSTHLLALLSRVALAAVAACSHAKPARPIVNAAPPRRGPPPAADATLPANCEIGNHFVTQTFVIDDAEVQVATCTVNTIVRDGLQFSKYETYLIRSGTPKLWLGTYMADFESGGEWTVLGTLGPVVIIHEGQYAMDDRRNVIHAYKVTGDRWDEIYTSYTLGDDIAFELGADGASATVKHCTADVPCKDDPEPADTIELRWTGTTLTHDP